MQNPAAPPGRLYGGRKAQESLEIIIVGCGLGGLAAAYCLGQAGHRITVFESAAALSEVGAGIQVCPNLSRLLIRWGLKAELERLMKNDTPSSWSFFRYEDGRPIGIDFLGSKVEREHGAPWYVTHRNDLHKLLLSIATPFMNLMLDSKVKDLNPNVPSVTLESGATFSADLIIGADGIHSVVRGCVVGHNTLPLSAPVGDMAYRATVSTEHFLADPDLKDLVENPRINCWMGPFKHIIGYCIRDRKEFNLVMLGPDNESAYSWTAKGDRSEVKAVFSEWEPRLQKIISHIKDVLKTKLVICAPLKTWTHSSGKVTLMGDACHPMLPYRAQGAAMAVEDAAVLGNLFSRLQSRSQIPMLLKAYEEIRYRRATDMQTGSADNRRLFHMTDGPEQQARDATMLSAMEKATQPEIDGHNDHSNNDTPWGSKSRNAELFGYDADEVVDRWWRNYRSGKIQVLANL